MSGETSNTNLGQNKYFETGRNFGLLGNEITKEGLTGKMKNQISEAKKLYEQCMTEIEKNIEKHKKEIDALNNQLNEADKKNYDNRSKLLNERSNFFIGGISANNVDPQLNTITFFYNTVFSLIVLITGISTPLAGSYLMYRICFHQVFSDNAAVGIFLSLIISISFGALLVMAVNVVLARYKNHGTVILSGVIIALMVFALLFISDETPVANNIKYYLIILLLCVGFILIKIGLDSLEINLRDLKYLKERKLIKKKINDSMAEISATTAVLKASSTEYSGRLTEHQQFIQDIERGYSYGVSVKEAINNN